MITLSITVLVFLISQNFSPKLLVGTLRQKGHFGNVRDFSVWVTSKNSKKIAKGQINF